MPFSSGDLVLVLSEIPHGILPNSYAVFSVNAAALDFFSFTLYMYIFNPPPKKIATSQLHVDNINISQQADFGPKRVRKLHLV